MAFRESYVLLFACVIIWPYCSGCGRLADIFILGESALSILCLTVLAGLNSIVERSANPDSSVGTDFRKGFQKWGISDAIRLSAPVTERIQGLTGVSGGGVG